MSRMADLDIARQEAELETCDNCEKPRVDVKHRHDYKWCNGIECGANLCDNCADGAAEAYAQAQFDGQFIG